MYQNSSVPPYCNTGVVNTNDIALTSCVDWLSITLLEEKDWTVLTDIIGINNNYFLPMKHGRHGYKSGVIFDDIKIYFNGLDNMGIHLEMSGQGCRTFENVSSTNWLDLFKILITDYAFKINISRIDLAIDDFYGYFRIPTLIKYLKKGHVTSRFKIARRLNSIIIKTGEEVGHTLYFGSSQSDIQIRFYEKNIEQTMKGNELPENINIWNRTEVQARDERAKSFVNLIANEDMALGKIITGTLKNYIQFRKATSDKNKSRWPLASFWLKFLGDVDKISLTTKPVSQSIEKKYNWVDRSVTKTLAMLAIAFSDDFDNLINDFIDDGYNKLDSIDYQIIEKFKSKQISYTDFLSKKDQSSPDQR